MWQNENTGKDGQPTSYFSVSLERAYKDKKDEWQTTHSFRTADLPKVEVVIRKAFEYLVLQQAA
ncbi:TPA: hypothetical protein HA369_07825 [Candidatus Woesearchaeota archaeon]|nr:hypothetical protein [Candidatus Woesearchaeota archaeon]HIJ04189.1 hypothetical protein [Candidatus Woesearchaeota archaeon]